jgi:hypothetical protein
MRDNPLESDSIRCSECDRSVDEFTVIAETVGLLERRMR